MSTKGIVPSGKYTFNAAAKTITFSSDYTGMSLSDITYITNIKSGVATVIYDPFDATKGGTLSGLVLTLAYNTAAMSNSDPLQIIVGYVAPEPEVVPIPIEVYSSETFQQEQQRVLIESIADNIDLLAKALDRNENIELSTRDVSIKKDPTGAIFQSDAPGIIPGNNLTNLGDTFIVDNTGYSGILFVLRNLVSTSMFVSIDTSIDGVNWTGISYSAGASGNAVTFQSAGNSLFLSTGLTYTLSCSTLGKFTRLRVSQGSGSCTVFAMLRNFSYGANHPTGLQMNLLTIGGTGPQVLGTTNTNTITSTSGGFSVAGGFAPTQNPPNAAPTVQTNVPYPIGIGGREQPYMGALAGVFRYITVDSNGRLMLGTDTGNSQTNTAPARGVGGRPNTMQGSQALLVEDIGQSEGDTTPMLLQQILVELKMLNQQLNELPFNLNEGLKMQNEVAEYRQEEYNNHVNNQ